MNEIERAARECWLREGNTQEEVDELIKRCKQDEWISVKDRLPEDVCYVLAYSKDTGTTGFSSYSSEYKIWTSHPSFCITHWMPLPEPPE